MNTNIDPFDIPDEKVLEQLMNDYFRESGAPPPGAEGNPFPGTSIRPASVAGSGVSPSAAQLNGVETFDLSEPPTSLPDPHFAGKGQVPSSVAGSGISPSRMPPSGSGAGVSPASALAKPHAATGNGAGVSPSGGPATAFAGSPAAAGGDYYFLTEQALAFLPAGLPESYGLPKSSVLPGYAAGFPGSSWSPGLSGRSFPGDGAGGIAHLASPPYDVNRVKSDFPILRERVNGRPLIWLDNAATTQKPWAVIQRLNYFYEHENSNIHRAAHELAARATDAYEAARKKVQAFLNASSVNEIVFVRGATEAINLVAKSWGEQHLRSGDEIIVSHLEHHANIVPWQQLAARNGLTLKVIPVDEDGQVILGEYAKLLGPRTRLVSFTQVSNALGTITPAKAIVEMAHAAGAKVLVDGAQAVSHMRADVRALNCDWYVFSGHKVFGPTGIGVLYGKEELLNATDPWQGGGNMIQDVTFEHTKYQNAPARFEAGTGNIADAVGLGAAIDYVTHIGIDLIGQYEHALLHYATRLLKDIPGLRLIGTAPDKAGVLSFVLDGYRTEEVGAALNEEGIAVRSGHHCAQPILRRFGVESTVRPSLALYNTCADIDALVSVLHRLPGARRK